MGSNLVSYVFSALKNENIRSAVGWTDCTVVLYWLNQSKTFIANGVSKMKQNDYKMITANTGSREVLLYRNCRKCGWKALLG